MDNNPAINISWYFDSRILIITLSGKSYTDSIEYETFDEIVYWTKFWWNKT